MKKFIFLTLTILVCICSIYLHAEPRRINTAIFDKTYISADSTGTALTRTDSRGNVFNASFLKSIVISSGSVGGILRLYDRSGSTTSAQIALIDASTSRQYNFNCFLSSGATYVAENIIGGITAIFR